MWVIFSIFAAFYLKAEIPKFTKRTNQQIYQDTASLVNLDFSEQHFLAKSKLRPKQSQWANLFFVLFPLITLFSESPMVVGIFILLCFLSLLDICYYLADLRAIILIFLLVLVETLTNFHNETLLFTLLFCIFITIFSQIMFKKETFGSGDMLLLCALSPLFESEKMLLLMLIASLLGIFTYGLYWRWHKRKLEKLPFIPFISIATAIVYLT
ncbi:prepilin peptidase [Mannheimia granulomatis]|uniref:prepilin peptidase n=1 Tax=Mannheimia granulomatis TaxID=85402 RepID=UPI00047B2571|nr:prepilin peptidase [Mannheimia granulomatis]QLB19138.1 peptidase A24 [Mannheimia granulomatis]